MNNLKDIFFDCYDNFINVKNDELEDGISELEDDVYNLEGDKEKLEDEIDDLRDDLERIIGFVNKEESLDELKGKMKEYGYM